MSLTCLKRIKTVILKFTYTFFWRFLTIIEAEIENQYQYSNYINYINHRDVIDLFDVILGLPENRLFVHQK